MPNGAYALNLRPKTAHAPSGAATYADMGDFNSARLWIKRYNIPEKGIFKNDMDVNLKSTQAKLDKETESIKGVIYGFIKKRMGVL